MAPMEVAEGGQEDVVFLIGQAEDRTSARQLVTRYAIVQAADAALEEAVRTWDAILGTIQVRTSNPALDLLVNRWLLYQVLSCWLWGRSAFYQSGGAYGFRDQLQDVMAVVYTRPDEARAQILHAAAHQFSEGDVQHWWHRPAGRGVRTRISDDYLFLPFVVAFYVRVTGDRGILDVGGMVWYMGALPREEEDTSGVPAHDPLLGYAPTPLQKATLKYFFVVGALLVKQITLGVVTARYGVEGSGFYGIPLDRYLPYTVTRTWHLQLGIFWIATAWLATGLYVAPAVGGREPKYQLLGVNVLYAALVFIVAGSMAGQWLSVMQKLDGDLWFWVGHQGYEYVDLAMAEYWRWWVVHLWVEGFFEVFATVVIAFLFSRLQLIRPATAAALFSTCVFLSGGIIGTAHHLYFSGTPASVMALGAVFSALEVVPLVLIGFEAWENLRLARVREWVGGYRWALYFFVAVAFWNFLGAGLLTGHSFRQDGQQVDAGQLTRKRETEVGAPS